MAKRSKKIKKQVIDENVKRIKVRLDTKTVITVRNLAIFKSWKERYPNAEIIA